MKELIETVAAYPQATLLMTICAVILLTTIANVVKKFWK